MAAGTVLGEGLGVAMGTVVGEGYSMAGDATVGDEAAGAVSPVAWGVGSVGCEQPTVHAAAASTSNVTMEIRGVGITAASIDCLVQGRAAVP